MNHADDELVSSVLDGEASTSERALVETDPVLRARLAEFRALGEMLRSAPVPADVATTARERALAAFDAGLEPAAAKDPSVVPMRAPRPRDRARHTRRLTLAAAALVALVSFGVLRMNRDAGSDDTAAGSFATTELDAAQHGGVPGATSSREDGAPPMRAPDPASGATSLREATTPVDLGSVGTLDALRDAWRAAAVPAPPEGATSQAGTDTSAKDVPGPCGRPLARAVLAGRPVVLVMRATTISVLDATSCSLIGTLPN